MTAEAADAAGADLAQFEQAAAEVCRRAGAIVLEALRAPRAVEFKDERQTDPVTETDRRVEDFLRAELKRLYPTHGLLGEERPDEATSAEYLWVMDPLDGTANFANGLPLFSVSLTLLRGGAPVVGCLFMPIGPGGRAGVLHAARGRGTRFEGEPVRVAPADARAPRLALLPGGWRSSFALKGEAGRKAGDLRNLGSICLESAMVACGAVRWSMAGGPKLWDVAAGALLVREAGGRALVWERRAWRDLERFQAPEGAHKDGGPLTLRDWSRPVLFADPATAELLVAHWRWHRPPPWPVRKAVAAYRGIRRRMRARGKPPAERAPAL